MTGNNLSPLLSYVEKEKFLFDEYNQISYEELDSLLDKIYDFSNARMLSGSACICIQMENLLIAVIWLIFLIKENINFLLIPYSENLNQLAPEFCDNILTFKAKQLSYLNLLESFTLSPNAKFCSSQSSIKIGSGAALLMSSGTTGDKKFIYYENRNLINNAKLCIDRFRINKNSKILVAVPVNHMFGLGVGLLTSLITGATLYLIRNNNIIKFYDKIGSFNPTITLTTPALMKMMLTLNKPLKNKSNFITAGETLSQETSEAFIKKFGSLCNLYGSTEMGAIGTSDNFAKSRSALKNAIRPLKGVRLKINDNNLGELLCNHPSGFSYYLNAQGFYNIRDSYFKKWFFTKDLARRIDADHFVVEGRMDNCINRYGYLFSLETLEGLLIKVIPGISLSVVIHVGTTDRFQLVALCEVNAEFNNLKESDARHICKKNLKNYMIPDRFHFIQKLPYLENGKPDRLFIKNNYSFLRSKAI